ncbi:MAG: sugar ABC transporter ATP-binding protein [Caldilineaceae bacterium]|nr:sugar ABC transporter ATP-binding protein [Caldilineaceae bacterium]
MTAEITASNLHISLSAQGLSKRYGGVVALADGRLNVQSGEVVALVGANGSGKSTLSKIITGVVAPDSGELTVDGRPVHFASPQAAHRLGITAVYQELSLIPDMTVAENIWLTHEPLQFGLRVDRRRIRRRTEELLSLFHGTFSAAMQPDAPIASLSPDERQIVEILKALSLEPRLIILDEATASLDSRQVSRLFDLVARWKEEGRAVVFVSHRMEEIFRIADRAVVLRSGETVGNVTLAESSERELVELMIERTVQAMARRPNESAPVDAPIRLAVKDLHTAMVRGVSLEVRDGELVGLGGLQGQGQAELLLALFGAIPATGTIILGGEEAHFNHPRQAMRQGIGFVPGDRAGEGLLLIRSILENLQLPSWARYGTPVKMEAARRDADRVVEDLRLVMSSLDAPVNSLSGGNAQKVVLGKWLLRDPRLLLLNDPTKGVDVGAKGEFYRLLTELRAAGAAILFYSSDDEELLGLCDRVLVLQDGTIQAELSGDTLTRANLVAASMGSTHRSDA